MHKLEHYTEIKTLKLHYSSFRPRHITIKQHLNKNLKSKVIQFSSEVNGIFNSMKRIIADCQMYRVKNLKLIILNEIFDLSDDI